MSGGAFDYAQYRIADIYTEIEDEIYGHSLDDEFDVNRYIEDHWLEDSEKEYVRKHHHTIPNRSEYSKETIKEFKKGIALLKKAEVYAQRIDWLLSGDDGEDSFQFPDGHIKVENNLAWRRKHMHFRSSNKKIPF